MKYEVNWPLSFTPPNDTQPSSKPQLGSGLDAMTGTLKQSALSSKDGRPSVVPLKLNPMLSWYVIQNEASASEYIKHTLDGSISTFVNWFDMEPHLKDIVFSHRAFTVILQHDLDVVTRSAKNLVLSERQKIKISETASFNATYGDYYVSAMTTGQRRYVLWIFESSAGTNSAFDLKQMTAEIFKNDVSLESGCNLLANLASRIPCTTSIWSGSQPAEVQPQLVLGLLKASLGTDQLPILQVEIRPYDPSIIEGLPSRNSPPYTPNINTVRRLREIMLQTALLRISDRTSPLQSKEPFEIDGLIPSDLGPIANIFKSAENFDFILNLANMLLVLARFGMPTWDHVKSLPDWMRDQLLEQILTSGTIDTTGPGPIANEFRTARLAHSDKLATANEVDKKAENTQWISYLDSQKLTIERAWDAAKVSLVKWVFATLYPPVKKFLAFLTQQWRVVHQLHAWLIHSRAREISSLPKLL